MLGVSQCPGNPASLKEAPIRHRWVCAPHRTARATASTTQHASQQLPLVERRGRHRRTAGAVHEHAATAAAASAGAADAGASEPRSISLTLVSGYSGSGKSSLLKHVLSSPGGSNASRPAQRIGALVLNDGLELNLEPEPVKATTASSQRSGAKPNTLTVLDHGCICCMPGGQDVGQGVREMQQLAIEAGLDYDYLLIEGAGTLVPLQAATVLQDQQGQDEGNVQWRPALDHLVTVVDAQNFCNMVRESEFLADLGLTEDEYDDRTLADVLIEQVECANLIVLNKVDTVSERYVRQLELVLRKLNRTAEIVRAEHGRVPPDQVLGTGTFDLEELQQSPGWLAELNAFYEGEQHGQQGAGAGKEEEEAHGISSFVYFALRPFHPQRLMDQALSMEWQGVMRSKGFFWLASRHDIMGAWQSAGAAWQGEPRALWEAARPSEERASLPEGDISSTQAWHVEWGDRCQQIAWIGINMDEQHLHAMLDGCLLSDKEMAGGPESWKQFEDPLPPWSFKEPTASSLIQL